MIKKHEKQISVAKGNFKVFFTGGKNHLPGGAEDVQRFLEEQRSLGNNKRHYQEPWVDEYRDKLKDQTIMVLDGLAKEKQKERCCKRRDIIPS